MSTTLRPSDAPYALHTEHMRLALSLARKSPLRKDNFRVGAVVVAGSSPPTVLASGYTRELEGNTHAEQCCFAKLASTSTSLPDDAVLYTTMEPCNLRLSGNTPCVDRILALRRRNGQVGVETVYVGVAEPETFVGANEGRRKLVDAGVKVVHLAGMEEEILAVATAGHVEESRS